MMPDLASEGRVICCLQAAFPEAVGRVKEEFAGVEALIRVYGQDVYQRCRHGPARCRKGGPMRDERTLYPSGTLCLTAVLSS